MSNRKATKRALLTSVMALAMCVVMLVGTTFAWFTDTARTGVNTIKSGTLKVDIVNEEGASIKNETLNFVSADGVTKGEAILWEPGCTYLTEGFKIKNDGNLALKFKLSLNGVTGGSKLLEVLSFSVVEKNSETGEYTAVNLNTFEGELNEKDQTSGVLYIQATMDKNAGNEYQSETLTGLGITVYATQNTYESDSNGNRYDAGAEYPSKAEALETTYGVDGLSMPAGVEIKKSAGDVNGRFDIILKDEEAFVYFTQVFDRSAAYKARTEALRNNTVTRYGGESNLPNLNIWYYEDVVTLKMDCDVDLKGAAISTFRFDGTNYDTGKAFSGGIIFDGNGHTIKNAKIESSEADVGFFGTRVAVKNVTMENINVIATGNTKNQSAGVVFGGNNHAISGVTVKNCSVTGGKYTGAIIGHYEDGSGITGCTVENTVVSGQYKVGGVVGYVAGSNMTVTGNTLTNVTVKGDNLWDGYTSFVIGKIVGNWNAIEGTCKDNSFSGTTTATNDIGKVETRAEAGLNK